MEQGLAERVWTGGGGGGGVDEEGGWVGNQSLGELASIGGGRGGRMEGWVEGRGRKGCVEPGVGGGGHAEHFVKQSERASQLALSAHRFSVFDSGRVPGSRSPHRDA